MIVPASIKPFSWLLFLLTVAACCTLGSAITAAYWFYPDPVLRITSPVHVRGESFAPGGLLLYDMSYCKDMDIEAETHYSWNDDIAYATTGMTLRTLEKGCHSIVEAVTVPNIPAGRYRLEAIRIYHPSPLRTVEVRRLSSWFTIADRCNRP